MRATLELPYSAIQRLPSGPSAMPLLPDSRPPRSCTTYAPATEGAARRARQARKAARSMDADPIGGPGPGLAQRTSVLALVVRAVVARADRLPPGGVLAVPGDGPLEALVEAHARLPAQPARLLGAQGVAAVGGRAGGGGVGEGP